MKWSNMSEASRSALVFMVSSLLAKGAMMFTTPLFTRVMSKEEYGLVSNYISWSVVIEVFAVLSLTAAGVFNVGLVDYEDRRNEYIASITVLSFLTNVGTFVVVFALNLVKPDLFGLSNSLFGLMFLHFLTYPAQMYWITRERYEYRYRLSAPVTIGSALFSQFGSLVAVLWLSGNKGEIKLFSGELISVAFAIPILVHIFRSGHLSRDSIDIGKKTFDLAVPLMPHYLSQHVMLAADRVIVGNILGRAALGVYSICLIFNSVLGLIWSSINGSLVPYSYECLKKGDTEKIAPAANKVLVLFGAVCVLTSLATPEIFAILAPSTYSEGILLVPALVATAYLQALYNLFANVEFYYKNTSKIALATTVSSIGNVALVIAAVNYGGFAYVGFAAFGSYLVLAVFHYLGMRACTTEKIYDLKFISMSVVIVFGVCCASMFLFDLQLVRYFLAAAVLVFVVIYGSKVKQSL